MPDSPDYSKYALQSIRFSLQDMGELAVRIEAPISTDRRGDYVWFDDFRHGVGKWTAGGTGGTGSLDLRCDTPYHSPYYCEITAPTGNDNNKYIQKILGNVITGRIGMDAVMSFPYALKYMQMELNVYDGSFLHDAKLKYTTATNAWSLYTALSTFTDIYTRDIAFGGNVLWYPIKIVFDINTGKFVRFLLGQDEINISDYNYYKSAIPATPQFRFRLYAVSDGTGAAKIQVAQVIITHGEP